MPTNKYFKCPFCDKRLEREDMVLHIEKYHEDELPEGFTPLRATFHAVNRKDFSYVRPCRMCKGPTEWDENKGRYNQLCGSRSCHDAQVEKMKKDMGDKLGINRQTATAEGLQKMLANRKISGRYKFQDGIEFAYTGSYERKTLEFFDQILNIKGNDLMIPGPPLQYMLDGKSHIYIPDIYYIPYNLIIEVKDGGNRPNTNPQLKETRRRQMAKEEFIVNDTDFNYIRLTNNDFSQIISVFADLKMSTMEEKDIKKARRVVHVNEKVFIESVDASNFISGFKPKILKDVKFIHCSGNEIDKYLKKYNSEGLEFRYKNVSHWIIAILNNIIIGNCAVNNKNVIMKLFVLPKYRGYRIGEKMFYDIVNLYDGNKLGVYTDNEVAIRLYEKYGFVKVSKDKDKNGEEFFIYERKTNGLSENMVSTIHAAIPQVGNNDIVVVNYMQNNVFAGKSRFAISKDIKFDSLFRYDDFDETLKECNKSFLEDCKYSTYILKDCRDRVYKTLYELKDHNIDEHLLEYLLFGHRIVSTDQILFEESLVPYEDFYSNINSIVEATIKEIKGE